MSLANSANSSCRLAHCRSCRRSVSRSEQSSGEQLETAVGHLGIRCEI